MRIAVTGGSGFIGRPTVRYAQAQGHDAWTFDRADGHDIMGDLKGLKGAQAVIHLAGLLGTHELFSEAEEAVRVNVIGSLRVMQWCLDNHAHYVGITMPDAFPSIYTATKIASQRLATALHHSRGLGVAHVRAFNAYGPGQKHGPGHPQKIIPTFATLAWQNKPIPIWGDGTQTVDLVYSGDVAAMLVHATEFPSFNRVFDAGTGIAMTVQQVANLAIRVTGSTAGVQYLPMRDGEVPTHIVAKGEGWEAIGFQPEHSIERLIEVIKWYQPK